MTQITAPNPVRCVGGANMAANPNGNRAAPAAISGQRRPIRPRSRSDHRPTTGSNTTSQIFGNRRTTPAVVAGTARVSVRK